ncbi:MAG TPA: DNA internalization-related competence protein ComEC/Rec2 [Clostridiaceae bacterium]|nr:DNA internalization-related competence protein ComEC/Rec2 [Clostridiaceae bacterium]
MSIKARTVTKLLIEKDFFTYVNALAAEVNMKRPLVLATISLIVGILTGKSFNSVFFAVLSLFIGIVIVLVLFYNSKRMLCTAMIALFFYAVGFIEFLYVKDTSIKKFEGFYGENVTIRGFIDSYRDINGAKVSFRVKTVEITRENVTKRVRGKVLFTTLNDENSLKFDYGREVIISGKLNMPSVERNPGGFNYRDYLARSGVSATIFSKSEMVRTGETNKGNVLVKAGINIRDTMVKTIEKCLPEQHAGLLSAMLVGYREGLSKEMEEEFSDAGISHIIAVSGTHVVFIMAPLLLIFKKLHFNEKVANTIIIIILILFVFITGFQASVIRAVIMGIVMLLGRIIRRETDVYTSLSFAAMLLLLYNPFNLFDIGFQLSFAATLSLVLFYKSVSEILKSVTERLKLSHIPDIITDNLAITLAAQAGVLPITILYFNKISTLSVITNLLVVPLLPTITILGFIMVMISFMSLFLFQLMANINCILLSFILLVTKVNSRLPFSAVRIATPPFLFLVIYYVVMLLLLLYRPVLKKIRPVHYVAVFAVVIISIFISIISPARLTVAFIDIGQGDSALIRTYSGKTVLIDGGGSSGGVKSETNIGDSVVIPFLLDCGITRIDLVVATHGHSDHIEGLEPVIKSLDVRGIAIPKYNGRDEFGGILSEAKRRDIPVVRLERGSSIKLDDRTHMQVLNPDRDYSMYDLSLNNSSLVIKLHYENVSFLFTGDIEKEIEKHMVDEGIDLKADLLKVAHHGSDTSSTAEFIKGVSPKAAVISVGKNNFGHPSPAVLKAYEDFGIPVFRTDESGAVIVFSDGKKIWIRETIKVKDAKK